MIINDDVFNVIKTIKDNSISLVFCDPPYNLSSTWQIDPIDGKVKHKTKSDFIGKWEGLSGEQLEVLFKEMYRITKFGAYVVMYGIDRQQMPFEYYAQLAGFDPQQYLYSYKISSFPKASDVGKLLDKREGAEREVVGQKICKRKGVKSAEERTVIGAGSFGADKLVDESVASSDLAKKYDGHKLGVAPYKQVLETVFVFKKPYQKGMSNIDAIYEYEKGNKEISPAIVNIEAGRVKISDIDKEVIKSKSNKKNIEMGTETVFNSSNKNIVQRFDNMPLDKGRYPSQLFIVDDERLKEEIGYSTSDILDKQSGILISGGIKPHMQKNKDVGYMNCAKVTSHRESSSGGSSRINHKCNFTEEEYMIQDCLYEKDDYDILRYCTKVSTAERNAGCEEFDNEENFKLSQYKAGKCPIHNVSNPSGKNTYSCSCSIVYTKEEKESAIQKNNHPTLKSLELNHNITKLYTPPSENLKDFTIFNPFSGSGSEYIGLLSNGVLEDNIIACELNKDYYDISLARIEYWKDKKFMFRKEDKKELEKVKKKEVKEKKQDVKKSIF